MPFSVVLVDDEPWSLFALEKSIDFSGNGFHILLKTNDPLEALEFITNNNVNLVITDVKMPRMSGIELIENARRKHVSAEFAIVSGYAEFDYAVNALQNDAADYMLKPLDAKRADAFIRKMRERLQRKKIIEDTSEVEKLKKGEISAMALLSAHGFAIRHPFFCCVVIEGNDNSLDDIYGLKLYHNANRIILLCNLPSEYDYTRLIARVPDKGIKFAFSRMHISVAELPSCLREAEYSFYEQMIDPSRRVYLPKEERRDLIRMYLERAVSCLELANAEDVPILINELKEKTQSGLLSFVDLLFFQNQFAALIRRLSPDAFEAESYEHLPADAFFSRYSTADVFWETVAETLGSNIEKKRSFRKKSGASVAFAELLQYVNTHFDQDMYLKDLSRLFFINFSYCCDLFMKTTGYTFSRYVTKIRMEKAAEMLSLGSGSIEDTAHSTGYEDYYYFNAVFKKYYGITPYQFRKQKVVGRRAAQS